MTQDEQRQIDEVARRVKEGHRRVEEIARGVQLARYRQLYGDDDTGPALVVMLTVLAIFCFPVLFLFAPVVGAITAVGYGLWLLGRKVDLTKPLIRTSSRTNITLNKLMLAVWGVCIAIAVISVATTHH
jgi:hypothetical protein